MEDFYFLGLAQSSVTMLVYENEHGNIYALPAGIHH
jgi:hypothetical protein